MSSNSVETSSNTMSWVFGKWLTSGYKNTDQWKNPSGKMIFVAKDKINKNGDTVKEYNIVSDPEQLKRNLELTSVDARCFHEHLQDSKHCKIFLDFEIQGPFASEENPDALVRPSIEEISQHLDNMRDRIISKVYDVYQIEIQKEWFAFMESSDRNKISFHVVLTKGIYFTNANELKKFYTEYLSGVQYFSSPNIYGKGRLFRLPLCTKIGEYRPLTRDVHFSFEDHLITHCPLEDGRVVDYIAPKKTSVKRKISEVDSSAESAPENENPGEELIRLLNEKKKLMREYDSKIEKLVNRVCMGSHVFNNSSSSEANNLNLNN